jgi:RND family efflux transporter MFP subunit
MKWINLFTLLVLFVSCSKKIKIESIVLTKGPVESTVTTINSGTIEAKAQAQLAFGTIGRISKIYVSLGQVVKSGQIIAELENADLKAINNEAKKELSRAEELYKNGLVSIANLDSAKRASEVARLNFEKTQIIAPFDGMITAMDLKIGEFYQSTNVLNKSQVQIIDLKKRVIKGQIDEIDLQKVAVGKLARVKIPALKNQTFKAAVTKVVPYVSVAKDQDRTSEIELEIIEAKDESGKPLLIPVGASADVEIISENKNDVPILPAQAVYGSGKTRFVYKIESDKLIRTEVKIGLGNYERVEILDGVKESDKIALAASGVELSDGIKVEAKEKKWP